MRKIYKKLVVNHEEYRHIYTCGDIHGMFHLLEKELIEINFDKSQDLLIACGDLIDRGIYSNLAAQYLQEKWFKSVCGNHDYRFMNIPKNDYEILFPAEELFIQEMPDSLKSEFYDVFPKQIFICAEVVLPEEKIGIVHAESKEDWNIFSEQLVLGDFENLETALWGRNFATLIKMKNNIHSLDIIDYYKKIKRLNYNKNFNNYFLDGFISLKENIIEKELEFKVKNIDMVIHGHTIVDYSSHIHNYANRYYIDTGAFLSEPFEYINHDDNMKVRYNVPEYSNYSLTFIKIK